MRNQPILGPRSLTCLQVIRKSRAILDPATKTYGRCGECRTCGRLWLGLMRANKRRIPKAGRNGNIAGFMFTKRAEQQAA